MKLARPRWRLDAGRVWAYTGAILGGAVSIAANVAHSYVPPKFGPDGKTALTTDELAKWGPQPGAVALAIFWPVALFVVIEIFARNDWKAGFRWVLLRFGGLIPVATVAAVVSYRHLSGLLGFYREDGLTVTIGPLAVDGLMVMATGALIATSGIRTARRDQSTTVLTDAKQDHYEDDHTGPVLTDEEDQPTGPAERDREDQSDETSPEDQPPPVRRAPKTPRPRTARRTSPKVRPIESGTAARMDRLRKAYPQSVPSNGDIKKTLGITSQGTANNLRKALIAERTTKEVQA